ncbi:MAG TPA: hypothetical protein VGD41_06260, partial [Pyrinomonadaceae bacterium]
MKRLALTLTAVTAVLIAATVIQTATFNSRQLHPPPTPALRLDHDAIAKRLSAAIQLPTLSFESANASNTASFEKLRSL